MSSDIDEEDYSSIDGRDPKMVATSLNRPQQQQQQKPAKPSLSLPSPVSPPSGQGKVHPRLSRFDSDSKNDSSVKGRTGFFGTIEKCVQNFYGINE